MQLIHPLPNFFLNHVWISFIGPLCCSCSSVMIDGRKSWIPSAFIRILPITPVIDWIFSCMYSEVKHRWGQEGWWSISINILHLSSEWEEMSRHRYWAWTWVSGWCSLSQTCSFNITYVFVYFEVQYCRTDFWNVLAEGITWQQKIKMSSQKHISNAEMLFQELCICSAAVKATAGQTLLNPSCTFLHRSASTEVSPPSAIHQRHTIITSKIERLMKTKEEPTLDSD